MARIHDHVIIESGNALPSLGALIGSRVSSEVFGNINAHSHKSFFGSDFDQRRQEFFDRHVRRMDDISIDIARTVNLVVNPDQFRILNSFEDFQAIPPCMQLPIIMFEPVRRAFLEGRIEGFGFDPENLPKEDVYGRLIDNFTCEDVLAAMDENGEYEVTGVMSTDDPEVSSDELYAIRKTREYIKRHILDGSNRDPTAIRLNRG